MANQTMKRGFSASVELGRLLSFAALLTEKNGLLKLHVLARRACHTFGNDRLDKAQIEKSVSYPAFFYVSKGLEKMDFLKEKTGKIYFKYLGATFGSSLIASFYSIVDIAMVGHYQGPTGTAALTIIAPFWNIIYSLGLLMGIGGSVLFSAMRGKNYGVITSEANRYFTVSLIGGGILAAVSWFTVTFFEDRLLLFFGASEELLPLAQKYLQPIQYVFPVFLFSQLLAAFLRNDNAPGLATIGVLAGGIFNIFGDYFFIFTLDKGIEGAGIATALGGCISLIVMMTHFLSRKCTLKLAKPIPFIKKSREIFVTGFSTFFIDVAMGILTIFFNRQIMTYLDINALAVYGVIVNMSCFVQCCAYSVGQASQPMISTYYGAGLGGRIKKTLKYALYTVCFFGLFWIVLAQSVPNLFVNLFMKPSENILTVAPAIIRVYSLSFILLPLNIFSTYYFQALLKPRTAFIISIMRGLIVSGTLIFFLPLVLTSNFIWFAMPITEFIIFLYVALKMRLCTTQLSDTVSVNKA